MNCLDDIQMEKLVLREMGGESQPPNIYLHISGCQSCQDRWSEQKAFYHEAQHTLVQSPSRAEKVLAHAVESPSETTTFLTVYPYSPRLFAPAFEGQSAVMAADAGLASKAQAHRRLGLLADERHSLLIRLLQSISTNNITGHLIADNPALYRYVVLRIADRLFASDALGRVSLEGVSASDLESQVVQIQLPCAIFRISETGNRANSQTQPQVIRIQNEAREVIRLEFPTSYPEQSVVINFQEFAADRRIENPDQLHVLLSQPSMSAKLAPVVGGMAMFEGIMDTQEMVVRVFE